MSQRLLKFKPSIDERFAEFHDANPHVYEQIVTLAHELLRKNRKRMSMETIFGKIRWDMALETTDPHFKLNDHFTSRYVRKLIADYPVFEGRFETRELRS
jgi:hypothetical protein